MRVRVGAQHSSFPGALIVPPVPHAPIVSVYGPAAHCNGAVRSQQTDKHEVPAARVPMTPELITAISSVVIAVLALVNRRLPIGTNSATRPQMSGRYLSSARRSERANPQVFCWPILDWDQLSSINRQCRWTVITSDRSTRRRSITFADPGRGPLHRQASIRGRWSGRISEASYSESTTSILHANGMRTSQI